MKKANVIIMGSGIIGTAIIWGSVIVGCSLKLRGTSCYHEIQNILVAGTLISIMLLFGILASLGFKDKTKKDK